VNRFQFVADHRDAFEVKRLCAVLHVSRSSFYAWLAAAPARAARADADTALAERIRAIHDTDTAQGVPRITAELNDGAPPETRVNHKRVARVMRQAQIAGLRLRRRVRTTVPEPAEQTVPDLLGRDFTASAPNQRYVGSGSRREFHPPAPTEPCVIVSHYTAPAILITRSCGTNASERTSTGIFG
jgi:transposase InsO family protein